MRNQGTSARLRSAILSSLFAALTAALSLVSVPLPLSPVPVTGQTFGVMLAGLILGPWWGAASILVYLAIGALGFPVFAAGRVGLGTLTGPTGGYLMGFVLGAWVTGAIARLRARRTIAASPRRGYLGIDKGAFGSCLAAALVGGVIVVHLAGSLWLAFSTGRTPGESFALGSAPFLPGDSLKAIASALVAPRLRGATGLLSNRWR